MPDLIERSELLKWMEKTPHWDLEEHCIRRSFKFDSYMDGVTFVNEVAEIAERANHHPDIDLRWCRVDLLLTTHSEDGLTQLDFDVAVEIDALRPE